VSDDTLYHVGFGPSDLADDGVPSLVLLCGDPQRTATIATTRLAGARLLSDHRGLTSYVAVLPAGQRVLCCTSGMGAPSMSIVVNELAQLGVRTIIRIGTCGSIQPGVPAGSVVVSSAALCRQGAALDIAPVEYPAVADPFLTVILSQAATSAGIEHRIGITASVDTFFEGQERTASSANPHLLRRLVGITDEYRRLGIVNYEMEAGTLFKMASVYGLAAGCVCGVVAARTEDEEPQLDEKDVAVDRAITVALAGAERWLAQ
jgi:uridine phosphorylase